MHKYCKTFLEFAKYNVDNMDVHFTNAILCSVVMKKKKIKGTKSSSNFQFTECCKIASGKPIFSVMDMMSTNNLLIPSFYHSKIKKGERRERLKI